MKARMRSVARILAVTALMALAWPVGIARSDEPSDQVRYPTMAMSPLDSPCGTVRVLDYDGVERDWDWLVATFGDVWVEPGDGSACLTELRAIRDDSTLNVRVEDAEGRPVDGIPVVFHWSDAPLLPPELVGCYDRGVYGGTGEHIESEPGTVGFGMGSGAFYCPPSGGPHTVWVGIEGSDCVHGLGMLCWTNHYHVNPTFVLAGESLPSPTLLPIGNADGDGTYLVDWSAVAGATAYALEEDDNYGFTSPTVRYAGGSTQYQVGGQARGHAGTTACGRATLAGTAPGRT